MMSPAQDTAQALTLSRVVGEQGGTADWAVFIGREPLVPENVVTVYDTGGGPSVLVDLRKPTVQVRVRATEYLDGWLRSNEAYKALVEPVTPSTVDGITLQWISTSEVAFIGRDDADRCIFTCNYQLLRDGA